MSNEDIGKHYGAWLVERPSDKGAEKGRVYLWCFCDPAEGGCGNTRREVNRAHLRNGSSTSCGCNTKHGPRKGGRVTLPRSYGAKGARRLNIYAVESELGISISTLKHRQKTGWWPGRTGAIPGEERSYQLDGETEDRKEETYLEEDVIQANQPRTEEDDGLRTIDGEQRITWEGMAKRLELTVAALRHWDSEYRAGELSDPEGLYPRLDLRKTKSPYDGKPEITARLRGVDKSGQPTGFEELERKIGEGAPEILHDPTGEEYRRDDLMAKDLGVETHVIRRYYQNTGEGKPRPKQRRTKSRYRRHSGTHHLNGQKMMVLPGPWYVHSGPATRYCRVKDGEEIRKSMDLTRSGEHILDGEECVDSKVAKKLGLDPDAVVTAYDQGRLRIKPNLSRKSGHRKARAIPKKEVLDEIKRREAMRNGRHEDGSFSLALVVKDYGLADDGISERLLRDAISLKVLPAKKQSGEWTVLPPDAGAFKAKLTALKKEEAKNRNAGRPAGDWGTEWELAAEVGADTGPKRYAVRGFLCELREADPRTARRPESPIKQQAGERGFPLLYDRTKALPYIQARIAGAAPALSSIHEAPAPQVAGARTAEAPPVIETAARLKAAPDTRLVYTTADQGLTISQASSLSSINKGVISRAVRDGEIASNGKKGRACRIDPASFSMWHLKRINKPELAESNAAVERKLNGSATRR